MDDDIADPGPEEFAHRLTRAWSLQRTIAQSPNRVFFYPAGLYDGRPLLHFAHLCDTFIYCDVAFDATNWADGLQMMLAVGAELLGQPERVSVIADLGLRIDDRPAWLTRYLSPAYVQLYENVTSSIRQHHGPSGQMFRCAVGGRTLTVYCFCAEAFQWYTALFTRNNAAPKAVCLMRSIEGHRRLLDMDDWDSPLGRSVADSPQPELLVTGTVRVDTWPWRQEWQQFANGQIVAYQRQHQVTLPAP